MKLLYDLSSAQIQGNMKINGGGEYSLSIFDGLMNRCSDNVVVLVLLNACLEKTGKLNYILEKHKTEIRYYNSIKEIEKIIENDNISEVIFPVCYYQYSQLVIPNNVKIVSVIHDLCDIFYDNTKIKYGRFIKNDGLNLLRWIKLFIVKGIKKRKVISQNNKLVNLNDNQIIITVSEFSKASLFYHLNINDINTIKVLYTAPKLIFNNDIENVDLSSTVKNKKYFLLTAGCRWTKNNAIVLKAFSILFNDSKYLGLFDSYKVILIGNSDESIRYYKAIVRDSDCFEFEKYVSDEQLELLYRNAYALVFPSVLEGFGMPPLEAMRNGIVPICSTAMSIPEICKDGALYFDPYDVESIICTLVQSLDANYYSDIKKRAEKRFQEIEQKRCFDKEITINYILGIDNNE